MTDTTRDVRPLPLRERYGRGERGVCAACGQTRVVYPRHLELGRWCSTCIDQETRRREEARDV